MNKIEIKEIKEVKDKYTERIDTFEIKDLVRPNILNLKPYQSAREEFQGKASIFLDANESPFGELNRYPDPKQRKLKRKLSELKGVEEEQIFFGNGSNEVIDLAFRIFCEPGKDKALIFTPTYGMYGVSAAVHNIELLEFPLDENFKINTSELEAVINNEELKLLFICNPNNPTGNSFSEEDILFLLHKFKGIVIVDEAYIDFSEKESFLPYIQKYPNLIISQTFSKAWGLAAVRVGVAYADKSIIGYYDKVKPPYNVGMLSQEAVLHSLNNKEEFEANKQEVLREKKNLVQTLGDMEGILKIYPSDANFILIEVANADKLYEALIRKNIIARNRSSLITNTIRITIGTREENQRLIQELQKL